MTRQPHARPAAGPSLRQCGNPACRICRNNVPGEPPDSGHPPRESLASLFLGLAAIVLCVLAVVLWWAVAS